jgi:hypothetical protein
MKNKTLLVTLAVAFLAGAGLAQTVETVPAEGLYEPYGIVADETTTNNYYYVTDSANNRVVRFAPLTGQMADLTGPWLFSPAGIARLPGGLLVVADSGHHRIMLLDPVSCALTLLAGSGSAEPGDADGVGAAARFNTPAGVAVYWDGAKASVYIADLGNNVIRKLDPSTLNVTTVAVVAGPYSQLKWPAGVAVDGAGRIYVADTGNHSIKTIETDGTVKLYAGSGSSVVSGSKDAIDPLLARFRYPRGLLWLGGATGLLVSDTGNHTIRRVGPRGVGASLEVTTVAGQPETSGKTDGAAATAQFWEPVGLAVDLNGMILVADLKNNALRRLARERTKPLELKPPAGRYSNEVAVAVSSLTTNAEFYYTLDGTDPTRASSKYTGPVPITRGRPGTNSTDLRVRGFSPDFAASEVLAGTYAFFVSPLTNAPAAGAFTNNIALKAGSETKDVQVRYTTDGTSPNEASPLWDNNNPDFGQSCTFKAIGFRDGYEPTAALSLELKFQVAAPVIEPAGGTANNAVDVKLTCGTQGADVRWTLSYDGKEIPKPDSPNTALSFPVSRSGVLNVMAFKAGYADSALASATFNLVVDDPFIRAAVTKSDQPINVKLSTRTEGALIYYSTDGTDPARTNETYKVGPVWTNATDTFPAGARLYTAGDAGINLTDNGTLKARAFRLGFTDSAIMSQKFDLQVAKPLISPPAMTNENAIQVILTKVDLPDAELWFTTDGSEPDPSNPTSTKYTGPLMLANTCTLKVKGFYMGFAPSETATGDFKFFVAPLVVDKHGGTNINEVTLHLTDATHAAILYYTLDGTTPSATNYAGRVIGPPDAPLAADIKLTANAKLRAVALRDGFLPSDSLSEDYYIQVDKPQILQVYGAVSKAAEYGYFPEGATVDITWTNPNAKVYYTLDGKEPTEESTPFTGKFKLNAVTAPKVGLQLLKARAFAPDTVPSEVASVQPIETSAIGIPQDAEAGIGATIVLPVVVNMKPGEPLRSVQYRVLVYPTGGAPNLASDPRVVPANESVDFVTLAGSTVAPGPTTVTVATNRLGPTNILEIWSLGKDACFGVESGSYGVAALLAVPIPTNALVGQTYAIQVADPSGTADGEQAAVELAPLPARTITVKNVYYRVGNTAPGAWYNAGTFGDRALTNALNNADANNAFAASLGVRLPFPFTDAFDAMDAFPLDKADRVGGDGQIRYLDWQHIVLAALRPETTAPWWRSWSAGGVRVATGSAPAPLLPAQSVSNSLGLWGQLWPDAELAADNLGDVQPGQSVSVPVTVNVLGNGSLAGLQFRAIVLPENGAPPLEQAVSFAPAPGLPAPLQVAGLPLNQAGRGWSPLLNPFRRRLTGRTPLGAITFTVPATALPGQSYSLQLACADGAPDLDTQYDFTVNAGSVNVGAPAKPPVPPRAMRSFKLRWQAQAGSLYVIESTTDLASHQWTVEADELAGQNGVEEWLDENPADGVKFYRVRAKR